MKLRRRFVAAFVAAFVILAAVIAVSRLPQTDAFFVTSAAFAHPSLYDSIGAFTASDSLPKPVWGTVAAHRINEGEGAVLAYRWFSPGNPVVFDDEQYSKLTIWLPHGIPSERGDMTLSGDSAVGIYSQGNSPWPWELCFGYVEGGLLTFRALGERTLTVQIEAVACHETTLRLNLHLEQRQLQQLTPFQGVYPDTGLSGSGIGERYPW